MPSMIKDLRRKFLGYGGATLFALLFSVGSYAAGTFNVGGCLAEPNIAAALRSSFTKNPTEVAVGGALGTEVMSNLLLEQCNPMPPAPSNKFKRHLLRFSLPTTQDAGAILSVENNSIIIATQTPGIAIKIRPQSSAMTVSNAINGSGSGPGWTIFDGNPNATAPYLLNTSSAAQTVIFQLIKSSTEANEATLLNIYNYQYKMTMVLPDDPASLPNTVGVNYINAVIMLPIPVRTCTGLSPDLTLRLQTAAAKDFSGVGSGSVFGRVFTTYRLQCQPNTTAYVRISPNNPTTTSSNDTVTLSQTINQTVGIRALVQVDGSTDYVPLLSTNDIQVINEQFPQIPLAFEYYQIAPTVTPGPIRGIFTVYLYYP